ncbi:hypothetical protein D3C74_366960 [compost metagenome]
MSSMRTESDSGPVPERSADDMAPESCSMWCPNSCATTYSSASGPPDEPKRSRSSSKNETSRYTLWSGGQ